MQKLISFLLASVACLSTEAAQWQQLTPISHMLASNEDENIVIIANLIDGRLDLSLFDKSGRTCGNSASSEPSTAGSYKVNGRNIKFLKACQNGSRTMMADTPEGQEIFEKSIISGPATIELESGTALHFNSENFESVKQAMLAAKYEIHPVIILKTDGSNRPTVFGETNLPEETELSVTVRVPGQYGGMANATVHNHRFKAGPFTVNGGPLPPGEAIIDAQTPLPQGQPDSVRQVIGEYGENLRGPLVYTIPGLSGRMIKAITRATIN